jgi:hypothetical protein
MTNILELRRHYNGIGIYVGFNEGEEKEEER